jgi:hypothetical protein
MATSPDSNPLERLRDLLAEATEITNLLLGESGVPRSPALRPNLNLSHLSERSAIPVWLDHCGPAKPAEIKAGLTACGVKRTDSTQQQIYQLSRQGTIRRIDHGLYDANRSTSSVSS